MSNANLLPNLSIYPKMGSPFVVPEIPYVSAPGVLSTVGLGGTTTFKWDASLGRVTLVWPDANVGYVAGYWNGDDEAPVGLGYTVFGSHGIQIWTDSGSPIWSIKRDGVTLGLVGSSELEWLSYIYVGSAHQFGTGDFDILKFGNDLGGIFSGTPFRVKWDDTSGYVTWDDGVSGLLYLRANLAADYISSLSAALGDITATQVASTSNDKSKVPLIAGAANASALTYCAFTYRAPATFTVTTGSPGKLNVTNTFVANECVKLTTTGTLPTEINTSTVYYVRNPSGSQIELSTTSGGASINIVSGAGTGTHTVTMLCKITATSHGRSARDPVLFAGGTPLPTGLTASQTYYVSDRGLTADEFYVCNATNTGIVYHVVITSAGSGAPFCYGGIADLNRWNSSNGSQLAYLDKYGNLNGSLLSTPWRIGHIPADSNYSGIWFSSAAASPTSSNYAFLGDVSNTFLNGPTWVFVRTNNTNRLTITNGYIELADAHDFVFNTSTGTKIGRFTNNKLAFWAATPIVQPTTAIAAATRAGGGGTALTDTDTYDGYTIMQVVKALRNEGLLA